MRLLVDGFLGDEEVFRSFGHTFLHEQQHLRFDHWKKFQASQAVKDIMLLDHGFQQAEFDRVSNPYDEEGICGTEHDDEPALRKSMKDVRHYKLNLDCGMTNTVQGLAAPARFASTVGDTGEVISTSSSADSVVTPTVGMSMGAAEAEIINLFNLVEEFIEVEDWDQFAPCLSPENILGNDWFAPYRHDPLVLGEKFWGSEARALLQSKACDQMFSDLILSVQIAAEPVRGEILTLLDPRSFDPRADPATAAVQMEKALQVTMKYRITETGEIILNSYLRHELYNWGNMDWVVVEAARHGCHWILTSTMPQATVHPTELAYQTAKHAASKLLKPILEVLSSFEPDIFRLCIDHAAKATDTRSVRALLSAAKDSKDLRYASLIWEAAMTGDAQVLWFMFGSGARKTVLILLQEAGNIRVRQTHEIFTRRHPHFLKILRKASWRFLIGIESLMCMWDDGKPRSSLPAWNRGIRDLKRLVQGNIPDNFPDVMLLLSIAKSLSTTLDGTYTLSKSWTDAFLRDLPRWMILLPDSQHAAYAYCVRGLWGKDVNESISTEHLSNSDLLDRFQGLAICLLRDARDIMGLNENVSGNSLYSSQRRRVLYRDPADPASEESSPRSPPHHEAPERRLGSRHDQMGHEIDPEPNEGSPHCPHTWQAITERLRYRIPQSQVLSMLIMMGAIFFCLLQFTFCKFLTTNC